MKKNQKTMKQDSKEVLSSKTLNKIEMALLKGGTGGVIIPMVQNSTCAQESTCTLRSGCPKKPVLSN